MLTYFPLNVCLMLTFPLCLMPLPTLPCLNLLVCASRLRCLYVLVRDDLLPGRFHTVYARHGG